MTDTIAPSASTPHTVASSHRPERPARCRPTLAADAALVYRPGTNDREVPGYAGGGFTSNFADQGQLPGNVEMALDCQWHPFGGEDSVALTLNIDGGYGNHWLQTMALADRPSDTARHGFGASDASVGVRIPVSNYTLVGTVGRTSSTMGYQGVAPRNNFIRPWVSSFLVSPFSDTGVSASVEGPSVTGRVEVSAGPDRLPWTDNNHSLWTSFYFKYKILGDDLVVSANYQMGPDQDNDDDHWTHLVDLGLAWKPSSFLLLGLYGLYGRQDYYEPGATSGAMPGSTSPGVASGQTQLRQWGAVETYFDYRIPETPISLSGLFGAFVDENSGRTSTLLRTARGYVLNPHVATLHGNLGLSIHIKEADILQRDGTTTPMDLILWRFDAGVTQCLAATCGLPTGATLFEVGTQLVFQLPPG